jgi:solute carrier family 25 (mitochondrial folate transporter), member 32
MFTSRPDSPSAYRGLFGVYVSTSFIESQIISSLDGLSTIVRTEGVLGLFRGTSLALVGVSNGAIQFVAYEKMKKWGFDRKKRQYQKAGQEWNIEADKLVRCASDYSPHPHLQLFIAVECGLYFHVYFK